MAPLSRNLRLRLLLRSLVIQGSWNYRTMQGAGLGFILIPILRRLYGDDRKALDAALGRHVGFFNANPYLATVAVAALARMEGDGVTVEQVERFKSALVSPLGSLGDRLVWARWRPLCVFVALLIFLAGSVWWVACVVFLALYNSVAMGLRVWGLQIGWREGKDVGRALMSSRLRRLPDRLTIPLAIAGGAVLPPLVLAFGDTSSVGSIPVIGIALVLAGLGYVYPVAARRIVAAGLVAAAVVVIGLEMILW
jgi:mannose/fructose/N-acetylgalactosamine-specific phosphotransferase system component IID